MAYVYGSGNTVREGDIVVITTGSIKNRTLKRSTGRVVGFGFQPIEGTSFDIATVFVETPAGETVEGPTSRLTFITRAVVPVAC